MINNNEFNGFTFPPVPEEFDRCVRNTLEALEDKPTTKKRRRPVRFFAIIGVAAALCLGGTAFAVNINNWFPAMFPQNNNEALSGFVTAPEPETTVVRCDGYEAELEAVLYDEATGAGVVSFHLRDLKNTGVRPFQLSHVFSQYQDKKDLAWSRLVECFGSKDGELGFALLCNESDFCGGHFYLNETRSTANDYYIEGAFVLGQDYIEGSPLRVEIQQLGTYTVDSNNTMRVAPILTLGLPEPKPMPSLSSEDGSITLSQIGFHTQSGELDVDNIDKVSIIMKDGSFLVIRDQENDIDQVLYALGESSPGSERYDISSYVLAQSFDIADVQAIEINGVTYPLK